MPDTQLVRRRIWSLLKEVARPDSRFHLNFAEVIPGFEGDDRAVARVRELPAYRAARHLFVTPDNCLEGLRRACLEDGKRMIVSTYGIARGFVLLEPEMVPPGQVLFASWLDGLEHFGRTVTLAEIAAFGRFDLLVTGASAVSTDGIRFGKGHGFFDLEWGMFTDLGLVGETTPVVAVVHDVQLVEERLHPSATDIIVDLIATPTRLVTVERRASRPRGVKWELLSPEQIAATPPLQELKQLHGL